MYLKNLLSVRLISLVLSLLMLCTIFAPAAFAVEQPSSVAGTSAILVEPSSGEIMYEQNAYEAIFPASTTKVLTALLVFEAAARGEISLDDEITATQAIIDGVIFDASRVSPYIADGEVMTVKDYLYCVLLSSDCVACDILANYVCGSVGGFVTLMNQRASELGCRNSCFLNTHGYPTDGHYSCAYDLYLICAEALKYSGFKEIFGTIKLQLHATNKNPARMLYNTNFTLWNPEKITSIYCKYYYEFMKGGKTGSSNSSGHCLVSTAEKDGMTLVCVVTGAAVEPAGGDGSWLNASFTESARLYDWGFENYKHEVAVKKGSVFGSINIKKSDIDSMTLVAAEDLNLTLPVDGDNGITTEAKIYNDTVKAPVSAGDVMGELKIMRNGEHIATMDLLASRSAPLKKGLNSVIILLILVVAVIAGMMLYIVNSDDPAVFKEYKPKSTYRNRPKTGQQTQGSRQTQSGQSRGYYSGQQPQRRPQDKYYDPYSRSGYRK